MSKKQAKGQRWLTPDEEENIYGERLRDNHRGDARSHVIYFVKTVDNKSFKFTCKTKVPTLAYRYSGKKLKDKLIDPDKVKAKVRTLIRDQIADYLEARKRDVESEEIDQKTYEVIVRSLGRLEIHFGNEFPDELVADRQVNDEVNGTERVETFDDRWARFQTWHQDLYPGQTQFNVTKYASALFRWMHKRGIVLKLVEIKDRFAKKENLERKRKKQRIYTREEMASLCRAANFRDRLIVRMGYQMAFRIGDCVALDWARVHLKADDPYISFEGGDKEEKFVKAPIPPDVYRQLKILKKAATGPWVFPQTRKPDQHIKSQQVDFKAIRKRAKVTHGTFHRLRHTRLTLDFGNPEIPDSHVMLMWRVSYKTALEHYIHPTSDDRRTLRLVSSRRKLRSNTEGNR